MKRMILLSALLAFSACTSVVEKDVDFESGTAREVYAEALAFGQEQYPDAVLVGYTNHGPSVYRESFVPNERDVSGKLAYWSFVFAQSPEVLEDKVLNDEDLFSVEFVNSKLIFSNYADANDWTIDDDEMLGDALLNFDSDFVFEELMKEVSEIDNDRPYHVDYNMFLDSHEVTMFISDENGYSGFFDGKEGRFYNMEPFTILFQ